MLNPVFSIAHMREMSASSQETIPSHLSWAPPAPIFYEATSRVSTNSFHRHRLLNLSKRRHFFPVAHSNSKPSRNSTQRDRHPPMDDSYCAWAHWSKWDGILFWSVERRRCQRWFTSLQSISETFWVSSSYPSTSILITPHEYQWPYCWSFPVHDSQLHRPNHSQV